MDATVFTEDKIMTDISLTATDYKKKDSREKRRKENNYKKRVKDLFQYSKDRWVEVKVEARDKNNKWETDPEKIKCYLRTWREQRSKDIKRQCNKKLRRDKENAYQNGDYKKATEFWWELD